MFKYAALAVIPYPLTQEIGADYLAEKDRRCLPLLLTNPFADTVMTRTHTNVGFSDSSAYLLLTFAHRIYHIKLIILFYVIFGKMSIVILHKNRRKFYKI